MKKVRFVFLVLIAITFFGILLSKMNIFSVKFVDKQYSEEEKKENINSPSFDSDNDQYPEKENVVSPFFDKLTYYALGDSITFGADYKNEYQAMESPYPSLVSDLLNLKECLNYAISGSTVAENVDNLPSIYAQACNVYNADIISVMGGVNDYNRGVEIGSINDLTTDTFCGSLKSICEVLVKNNPNAFVFLMTPYKEHCYHEFECTKLNKAGYNLEDYAKAVKAVAELYNIPVLDMYNLGNFELEMYNADSDGIHPSQEFIKEYTAPQIVEFIKQHYK